MASIIMYNHRHVPSYHGIFHLERDTDKQADSKQYERREGGGGKDAGKGSRNWRPRGDAGE